MPDGRTHDNQERQQSFNKVQKEINNAPEFVHVESDQIVISCDIERWTFVVKQTESKEGNQAQRMCCFLELHL